MVIRLGLRKAAHQCFVMFLSVVLVVAMIPFAPYAKANTSDAGGYGASPFESDSIEEIALDLCSGDDESDEFEAVLDGLEDLESIGLDVQCVEDVSVVDEKPTYEISLQGEQDADVTILENGSQGLSILIEEDNASSVLTFADDGSLYLDGCLVAIKQFEEVVGQSAEAGSYFTSTNPCPGKTWSYQSTKKGSTQLPKELKLVGSVALTFILASMGVGPGANALIDVAEYLIDKRPSSKYVSVKTVKYYPSSGRRVKISNGSIRYVEKYINSYYATSNYTLANMVKTRYKVTDIN